MTVCCHSLITLAIVQWLYVVRFITTGFSCLKRSNPFPRRYRLAFLLALFVMTHLIWGTEMLRYFGGWTLLLFVMFPETLVTKIPADKTKDMLRLLSREDDRLRVGMEASSSERL